ncbi:hypothetical protein MMC34_005967 [Xylographa carneopallida]|nr:hypothetical protein [Xylographa carneopallida]
MQKQPSSTTRIRRWWTEEEDRILRAEADYQLENEGAVSDWNRIAAKLPARTNKDCRKRWSKVCEHIKKGAWSAAEDEQLRKAVEQFGYRWTFAAQRVENRHADQCAKRWHYFLDPKLDHSEWNAQDDEKLLATVDVCGRNWTTIHDEKFPGRSATDIKNRYVILNRRRRETGDRPSSSYPPLPTVDSSSKLAATDPETDKSPESPDSLSDGALPSQEDDYLTFAMNVTTDSSHPSFEQTLAPTATHNPSAFHPSDTDYSHLYFHQDNHDPSSNLLDLSPQDHHSPSSLGLLWPSQAMDLSGPWESPAFMTHNSSSSQFSSLPTPGSSVPTALSSASSSAMAIAAGTGAKGKGKGHRSTLILEDVYPDTVSDIMSALLKSKDEVKMRLFSQE